MTAIHSKRDPSTSRPQHLSNRNSFARMKSSMDVLTLFGLFAVTAMLLFYALEDRRPWFILAFAGACVLASAYGFLQGAWPFGIIEAIWGLVAIHRWRTRDSGRCA